MGKRWDDLSSPATTRRDNEVIVRIGTTVITRQQMINDLHCDYTRSGRTLTKKLTVFKPRNAVELARRVSMDDMLDLKRVGELAVRLFGLILIEFNVDPCDWADSKLKISTRYARVKTRKRKARVKRAGRLVLFRGAKTG